MIEVEYRITPRFEAAGQLCLRQWRDATIERSTAAITPAVAQGMGAVIASWLALGIASFGWTPRSCSVISRPPSQSFVQRCRPTAIASSWRALYNAAFPAKGFSCVYALCF